jgi:hypothetical protein
VRSDREPIRSATPSGIVAARKKRAARARDLADELHVVLDQDLRQPALFQVAEDLHQARLLGGAEPGGGLVEEEDARALRERAGDGEQAELAERERVGRVVGTVGEPDLFERLVRLLARQALLAPLPGRAEDPFEKARPSPRVAADLHRRPDVGVVRRTHHLEDGPEPGAGALMGRPARDLLALERDAAAVGPQKPADAVKKSGLPGPVRPDQAGERAALDGEANLLHGLDGAEGLRDRVDHEGRRVRHAPNIRRKRGRGRLALSRMPVALGDPSREAPARRPEPFGQLRVERGDLVTKLKEAKVQHALPVAHVRGGGRPVERRSALGAGHVARLRGRAEHRCK